VLMWEPTDSVALSAPPVARKAWPPGPLRTRDQSLRVPDTAATTHRSARACAPPRAGDPARWRASSRRIPRRRATRSQRCLRRRLRLGIADDPGSATVSAAPDARVRDGEGLVVELDGVESAETDRAADHGAPPQATTGPATQWPGGQFLRPPASAGTARRARLIVKGGAAERSGPLTLRLPCYPRGRTTAAE
jgi:hypothetical protein